MFLRSVQRVIVLFAFVVAIVSATSVSAQGPNATLTADRTTISPGQCANLFLRVRGKWSYILVGNTSLGRNISNTNNSTDYSVAWQECPTSTTTYRMFVSFIPGEARPTITINVVAPAAPPQQPQQPPQPQPQPQQPPAVSCGDAYEPNDTPAQARRLEPGQVQATICPSKDVDIYTINVSAGESVQLGLTNLPADYDLALYSGNTQREVASSDNGDTEAEQIRWIADKSDTLYVVVYGYNQASSHQPYTLVVNKTRQDYGARQIRFSVKGGTFTYLKIVGENQYGEETTWERSFDREQYYADTVDYWWKGTIVLEFKITNRGWRRCVIESLRQTTVGDLVPVTYTEGEGCSGDSGSTDVNRVLIERLYGVLFSEDDSLKVFGAVSSAKSKVECVKAIVEGFSGGARIIVGWECKDAALDIVNEVLKKYGRVVELNTGEASLDLHSYCTYKYGSGAYAVMGDRWDAWSWSCYRGNERLGGMDMGEACRVQHPDLPNAVMLDRWDAYSWVCR